MTSAYQNIRRLHLEKLTNSISEEDDLRLKNWLETDEIARAMWQKLEKEAEELNMHDFIDEIDPESELDDMKEGLYSKTPVFNWKPWAAAAVLAVGLGIGFLVVREKRNENIAQSEQTRNVKPARNGISLTTPDGKAITLSTDGSQTITLGDVHLDSRGGTLTYSGGTQESALNELHVPVMGDYEIVLADGTKVHLNSETKLRFPFRFTGNTREVYVEGEAFFDVKKNPAQPFIVHTALADMVVTGTSFNVNTYDSKQVKTALVEGKVQVMAGDKKPMDLLPGFEATANAEKVLTMSRFDADEVLSWKSGLYYFHNQPLVELSDLIARWYGVQVVFDNEQLKTHSVSGLLEKGRLEEFLTDLKSTSGIKHRLEGKALHLQ